MREGRQVYRDIEAAVDAAQARLDDLRGRVRSGTARATSLRQGETDDLERLARVRLADLDARRSSASGSRLDAEVLAALARRDAEIARIEGAAATAAAARTAHDAVRSERRRELDAAREARDACVRAVKTRLEGEEPWQFQRARAVRAGALAARADEKAGRAEADRVDKGKPYEKTKTFMYLWKRRYRFPEYRGGSLARWLDGLVARVCGYERAHRDYALLLEIPARLREHATAVAETAAAEAKALTALEDAALLSAGIRAFADAVGAAERALASAEGLLSADEATLDQLRAAAAQLDARDDRFTHEALDLLRAAVSTSDLSTLETAAAASPSTEDDELVASVAQRRIDLERSELALTTLRSEQTQLLRQVADLEEVRRRFRREEYDSDDSTFEGDVDAPSILGQLSGGILDPSRAMSRLRSHQRFRSRSSVGIGSSLGGSGFGFGSFGSSSSSGSHSFGGGSSSHISSGGGFGGGGSRTGGGFGGGGMRTGGGF